MWASTCDDSTRAKTEMVTLSIKLDVDIQSGQARCVCRWSTGVSGEALEQPERMMMESRFRRTEETRSPSAQRCHGFVKPTSRFSELIDVRSSRRWQLRHFNESSPLHFSESGGEEAVANPWQCLQEITEALRPGKEFSDKEKSPSFADHIKCFGERTVLIVVSSRHSYSCTKNGSSNYLIVYYEIFLCARGCWKKTKTLASDWSRSTNR
jgi:hypothetical protein